MQPRLHALIVVAVASCLSLTACGNDRVDAIKDDYSAGYAAVAPRAFSDSANVQDKREQRCNDLTRAAYNGDPGFEKDSSDAALAFRSGCLDALFGGGEDASTARLTWLFDD